MSSKSTTRTPQQLRNFGFTLALAFGGLALFVWWRGRPAAPYLGVASALFLVSAVVYPALLGPVERIWMKMAHILGAIMTRVLLALTFYLIITPLGLFMRISGKDALMIRRSDRKSYWISVEPDGPSSRPDKPY